MWSDCNCSWGSWGGCSSNRQIFPLWGLFLPFKFFPLPMSLSSPYCYLKWDTKWINSQETLKKFSARIFMRICNSKTFNPLPSTEFLAECHQPTEQTLMENSGGSRIEHLVGFQEAKPNSFLFFSVFKAMKWVTITLKTIFIA